MLAIICSVPTCVFVLTFLWMPESPYYYLKKKNEKDAKLTLIRLRSSTDTTKELAEMSEFIKMEENASIKDLFTNRINRKALLLLLLLLTGQHFSGFLAVQSYVGLLLEDLHINIDSNMMLIIIGALSLVTSVISTFVVDRFGRKPLYLASSYIISLCLAVIGTYFLLIKLKINIEPLIYAPTVAIIIFFVATNMGISLIPAVVSSEIFPISVKSWATMIANSYGAVLGIIVAKGYQLVIDTWGYHVGFYAFAIIEFAVATTAAVVMTETKGKSFEEIQYLLRGSTDSKEKTEATK